MHLFLPLASEDQLGFRWFRLSSAGLDSKLQAGSRAPPHVSHPPWLSSFLRHLFLMVKNGKASEQAQP